jgi:hypothetical protein
MLNPVTQKDIDWFHRYTRETYAANAVYRHLERAEGKHYFRYFRRKNAETWLYLRGLIRMKIGLGVKDGTAR